MKIMSANSKQGLLQALGVFAYCGLIGLFMWNIQQIFGNAPEYLGPVTFLLLFSVSVLLCALIVFYKPYNTFFAGNKKDALEMVVYTAFWLFLFFVSCLMFVVLTIK